MKILPLLPLLVLLACVLRPERSLPQAAELPPPDSDDPWFQSGQEAIRAALSQQPITSPARNVILFVGDGHGVTSVTLSRIFEGQRHGQPGEEWVTSYEAFPYLALSKTYNTNQQVSDSAGTATAMLCGVKTKGGVIGVGQDVVRGDWSTAEANRVPSFLELAEDAGKSTGVVTTARLTHATPACAYAHSPDRNWECDALIPASERAKGARDIALQLIEFSHGDGLEVALGGGRRNFLPQEATDPETGRSGARSDGRDLAAEWLDRFDRSAYVWDRAGFDAIDVEETDHLLGLFEPSHMRYEADRAGDVGGEPSLAEMTAKAIDLLERDEDGYFLLVEAGRIDHAHHGGNAYRALTDAVAFAEAIQTAVDRTEEQETLIVVTADHSHVISMAGYPYRGNPILGLSVPPTPDGTRAADEPVRANDGKPYTTVGYWNGPGAVRGERPDPSESDPTAVDYRQQALVPLSIETHAGEDVAIYGRGPWAHLLQNTVEQHVIFHVMDFASGVRAATR